MVAIGASNCLEYTFLIPGILGCGATVTPCNPYYKTGESVTFFRIQIFIYLHHKLLFNELQGEILQQFRITEPKLMFVSEEALDTMETVKAELPCLEVVNIT